MGQGYGPRRTRVSRNLAAGGPAMRFDRITIEPNKMGGAPCIRGLRIPVATVVGMVEEGISISEVLAAYPDLDAKGVAEVSPTPQRTVRCSRVSTARNRGACATRRGRCWPGSGDASRRQRPPRANTRTQWATPGSTQERSAGRGIAQIRRGIRQSKSLPTTPAHRAHLVRASVGAGTRSLRSRSKPQSTDPPRFDCRALRRTPTRQPLSPLGHRGPEEHRRVARRVQSRYAAVVGPWLAAHRSVRCRPCQREPCKRQMQGTRVH